MIGVFDSGLGGLTVLKELASRFPQQSFAYLGDHANVPYGDRHSDEVVELTVKALNVCLKWTAILYCLAAIPPLRLLRVDFNIAGCHQRKNGPAEMCLALSRRPSRRQH